jgi:hypothetical protein
MGDDATTRREFMRFLYRVTIGSRVDEFFNDAPANEPKAKPETGSIAPRDVCKGKPDRERIPSADLLPLSLRSTN